MQHGSSRPFCSPASSSFREIYKDRVPLHQAGGSSLPPHTKAKAWSRGQEAHPAQEPAQEHLTAVAPWSGVRSRTLALADLQELLLRGWTRRTGRRNRARLGGPRADWAGSENRQGETPQAQCRHTSREGDIQPSPPLGPAG